MLHFEEGGSRHVVSFAAIVLSAKFIETRCIARNGRNGLKLRKLRFSNRQTTTRRCREIYRLVFIIAGNDPSGSPN